MSHGGYVGAYVLLVYGLPLALVTAAILAFSGPKARSVIAAVIAALLWGYAIWLGLCLLLYPGPLVTGLYGLAGVCLIAAAATFGSIHPSRQARRSAISAR